MRKAGCTVRPICSNCRSARRRLPSARGGARYRRTTWRGEMLAATEPGSEARAELDSIIGIGRAIAEELADFFDEERNVKLVDELAAGLPTEDEAGPRWRAGGGA